VARRDRGVSPRQAGGALAGTDVVKPCGSSFHTWRLGMTTVRDLIKQKGGDIVSVRPDDTVFAALKVMADRNVGAVMVMDEAGQLVGVLSERDYARKVVLHGHTSRDTIAAEIMTSNVVCIPPDKRVEEAMAMMTARRIRHLPVMDNGRLIGVVSIGDVGRAIIANQGFVIEQLERYICTS
jgi:CBS domain-containing protein